MRNTFARHLSRRAQPRRLTLFVASALLAPGYADAANPLAIHDPRRLAITFERNDGQLAAGVLYAARGASGELAIDRGGLAVTLPQRRRTVADFGTPVEGARELRIGLAGANRDAVVEGADRRATRSHYYLGNDRRKHLENVPHFGRVAMRDVYPGIDLALHGSQGALEYDFVVAPNADPTAIRLDLSSAERVWVDEMGALQMRVGGRTLTQHAPVAFQEIGGERIRVPAKFVLALGSSGLQATFALGDYDRSRELVIDPVIAFSTFLGGAYADGGGYMARDNAGRLHIAYATSSPLAPSGSIAITRIDPVTRQVLTTTTIGGSSAEVLRGIATRGAGAMTETVIVGGTESPDFPRCFNGNDCDFHAGDRDAFVTVLDLQGQLVYSRLIGGVSTDVAEGLAVDATGNVYLAGTTNGGDFPTTAGSLYPTRRGTGTDQDAFVTKLNKDGDTVFSTYLGGAANDRASAIAVDDVGNIHVAGISSSGDLPSVAPIPNQSATGPFIAKLNAAGSAFLYATHLGGSGDWVEAIAVDPNGQGLVVGGTVGGALTPLFPSGYRDLGAAASVDAFVARVPAAGGSFNSVLFLGGSGSESLSGLVVAANGDVYVTGTSTHASGFPKVAALAGQTAGGTSAFVARIRAGALDFSSALGGTNTDSGDAIAITPSGDAFVLGTTMSANFPVALPIKAALEGTSDMFLARITWADLATDSDNDGVPSGVEFTEGLDPAIKDNDIFTRDRLFVMQQYRDFLGREGDSAGINFYVQALGSGSMTRGQVIENFLASPEFQNGLPQCSRLYFAFFGRIPDYGGLMFQVGQYRAGVALELISQNFSNAPEFTSRYGALSNDAYINLVYQNVLGRAPDAGGFQFYKERLDDGRLTRGQMMIGFSESPEFQQIVGDEVHVIAVYVGMLRRAPEQAGLDFYVDQIEAGTPRNAIILGFMGSPEYRGRFLP